MTQDLKDFLNDLIFNLDLRLYRITEDSSIYDNCKDAFDLINKDGFAKDIYKRICEVSNYEINDLEELKEILQTYDIEISNYHQQINN